MNSSEQINELASALAKAQSEMEYAGKTSSNPFFKSRYADLGEIVQASREALTKHGLCVAQGTRKNADKELILYTRLLHSSGQWLESEMPLIPVKNDPQSMGSAMTYIRRYSYAALVGVVISDEDDDGNAAAQPRQQGPQRITPEQYRTLDSQLKEHKDIAKRIIDHYGSLQDIPLASFDSVLNKVIEQIDAKRTIRS